MNVIPAGVVDSSVELFVHDSRLQSLYKGQRVEFWKLPEHIIRQIQEDLDDHPEAKATLEQIGIHGKNRQIEAYASCRFGGFDGRPDLTEGGKLNPEYWPCGLRGKCPVEGKLCGTVQAEHGVLSFRELEVIKLIVRDVPRKLIADQLHITMSTVDKHCRSIYDKTGVKTNVALVLWATKRGIL